MNSKTHLCLAISLAASALLASGAAVADRADIPVVPQDVLAGAPAPITPGSTASLADYRGDAPRTSTSSASAVQHGARLALTPGVNELVPVSMGHLNRLVTPFSDPQVTTTSAATTEIRDNVVYVGTNQEAPVTLFITQKDSEAQAMSLTLVPQRIAPREYFLAVEGSVGASFAGLSNNRRAEAWESSQPYVSTLRELLRSTALGETPPGYSLHSTAQAGGAYQPSCVQEGLSFNFQHGQQMVGQNLTVAIGVAENISAAPIEVKEAACGDWNVAAVSVWPQNLLSPDDKTEVYVVMRHNAQRVAPESRRPSLLGAR
nr:type-F conjugative transfer system secretin TraK [uncultured Halomonas sp.]